jgi:hypothetical protein
VTREETMRATTIYLAKLLGLFTVVFCAWMMLNRTGGMALIEALFHQPGLQFTYAMIALGGGIAMVLGHNHWRPGVLTVVVTVIGWLIVLRGFTLLLAPGPRLFAVLKTVGFERLYEPVLVVPLLLGVYLTVAGFTARAAPNEPTSDA